MINRMIKQGRQFDEPGRVEHKIKRLVLYSQGCSIHKRSEISPNDGENDRRRLPGWLKGHASRLLVRRP
jgi:hypothetical protein